VRRAGLAAPVVGACFVVFTAASAWGGEAPEKLFEEALTATGDDYLAIRDRLVAGGEPGATETGRPCPRDAGNSARRCAPAAAPASRPSLRAPLPPPTPRSLDLPASASPLPVVQPPYPHNAAGPLEFTENCIKWHFAGRTCGPGGAGREAVRKNAPACVRRRLRTVHREPSDPRAHSRRNSAVAANAWRTWVGGSAGGHSHDRECSLTVRTEGHLTHLVTAE
jgi:hypothetical protein